jgi:hypothetical protein
MQVTPAQSVKIFGWWNQPRRMASWENLKALNMSWRRLRCELGFTPQQLHTMQPDKREWIARGALTLHDLPEMLLFPINPFIDLNADLAEVWSMQWPADVLADMGVTYEQMLRRGLNPQFMQHLNFSVGAWHLLKIGSRHIDETWTEHQCNRVFQVGKDELKLIFSNFEAVQAEQTSTGIKK